MIRGSTISFERMKLLVIDTVNYIDYPMGGILSYYRTMLPPCGNDLILVGVSTDDNIPVGQWSKRFINGTEYDFFAMARVKPSSGRPLIPGRITASYILFKNMKKVLNTAPPYDYIFTQSPEVLSHIPNSLLSKTCFVSAGMGNPLAISRYPWARLLAKIYDKYYHMPKVSKVRWHLAAADYKSMVEFAERSNGLVKVDDIISFPTRYNDNYFKVLPQNECRRQLGIGDQTTMFVTVGRLNWFKGWKLMIDAFNNIAKKKENNVLYFIGDGEEKDKIKDYAKELGIDNKVVLVGKRAPAEIVTYLNAANVFIMGSFEEGWSTTLVEACACGVPCVVTDFSGARDMIADGQNGYVVSTRNPELFASRMSSALDLDRIKVQQYDKRFAYLAQSKIKEELEKIISTK